MNEWREEIPPEQSKNEEEKKEWNIRELLEEFRD